MKRLLILLVAMMMLTAWCTTRAQTGPPIYGQVISQSRGPIAGITISLLHPTLGRSIPVFSQPNGYYFFTNVPPGQTYYIEAYWGNNLLYRGTVNYGGGSIPYNIPLP
jgi:hypothetical protein